MEKKIKKITNYFEHTKLNYFIYFSLIIYFIINTYLVNFYYIEYKNQKIEEWNKKASFTLKSLENEEKKQQQILRKLRENKFVNIESKVEDIINKYKRNSNIFYNLGFKIIEVNKRLVNTENGKKILVRIKYKVTRSYRSSYITAMYILSMINIEGVNVKSVDYKNNVIILTEDLKKRKINE